MSKLLFSATSILPPLPSLTTGHRKRHGLSFLRFPMLDSAETGLPPAGGFWYLAGQLYRHRAAFHREIPLPIGDCHESYSRPRRCVGGHSRAGLDRHGARPAGRRRRRSDPTPAAGRNDLRDAQPVPARPARDANPLRGAPALKPPTVPMRSEPALAGVAERSVRRCEPLSGGAGGRLRRNPVRRPGAHARQS